jgi:hypothetical protein
MLKKLDRALAVLLALGAIGHTFGSIAAFREHLATLLWALCASLLIVLLSSINLLRRRPGDRLLAWLAAFGTLSWLAVSIAFGAIIRNLRFALLQITADAVAIRKVAAIR